jgi:hypothetical protein
MDHIKVVVKLYIFIRKLQISNTILTKILVVFFSL